MSNFATPPFFSPNLMIATVMRTARALGLALPALKKIIGHANSAAVKAKVFGGYEPTEHDVFVATYSKSGTNWAMQMATQIAWKGEAEFSHIHDLVAWPEAHFAGIVRFDDPRPRQTCPTGRRMIKTAIDAEFVPYSEDAAYVTVIRDPKDNFVSAYHFLNGVFDLADDVTVEEWIELFKTPQYPAGLWPVHTASYWAWRDRPNVAVLFFSDMKEDLEGAVRTVAKTMRVELTDAEVARVVERCSFSWMKENEEKFGPPKLLFTRAQGKMLREGKVGTSKDLLSREQRAEIDRFCLEQLEALGSDFPYREKFPVVE